MKSQTREDLRLDFDHRWPIFSTYLNPDHPRLTLQRFTIYGWRWFIRNPAG